MGFSKKKKSSVLIGESSRVQSSQRVGCLSQAPAEAQQRAPRGRGTSTAGGRGTLRMMDVFEAQVRKHLKRRSQTRCTPRPKLAIACGTRLEAGEAGTLLARGRRSRTDQKNIKKVTNKPSLSHDSVLG